MTHNKWLKYLTLFSGNFKPATQASISRPFISSDLFLGCPQDLKRVESKIDSQIGRNWTVMNMDGPGNGRSWTSTMKWVIQRTVFWVNTTDIEMTVHFGHQSRSNPMFSFILVQYREFWFNIKIILDRRSLWYFENNRCWKWARSNIGHSCLTVILTFSLRPF